MEIYIARKESGIVPVHLSYRNSTGKKTRKVKLSLQQAVKAHRVGKSPRSHILQTIGSQMAVRLSALRAGRPLPPGRSLVLISLRS
jgi:hypothetical protein